MESIFRIIIMMSICFGYLIMVGCSDQVFQTSSNANQFSGNTDASKNEGLEKETQNPEQHDITINPGIKKPESKPPITPVDPVFSKNLVFYNTSNVMEATSYNVKKPVAIQFLIDQTASMEGQIETVKTNIKSFVDKLVSRNFEVKLGFVAYQDDVSYIQSIGSDVDSFKQAVGNLQAIGGGHDLPEAGLTAINKAVDLFYTNTSIDDHLKVMILISDAMAHDTPGVSTNAPRDCSITNTVNKLNGLTKEQQEQLKLFYFVPNYGLMYTAVTYGCHVGGNNPKVQLDEVLSQGLNKVASSVKKSGFIKQTFYSEDLINTVPKLIESVSTTPKMLCLTNKISVDLTDDLDPVEYQTTFGQAYQLYLTSTYPSINIKDKRVAQALQNREANISVRQSCFTFTDVNNGNFTNPITTKNVTIQFELRD